VCVRDTQVVRISRAAFRHIVARHPSVLLRFARMMARRLTQHLR
jgi:CRP-like cAMP-binding protein